jgi:hypothetical protein
LGTGPRFPVRAIFGFLSAEANVARRGDMTLNCEIIRRKFATLAPICALGGVGAEPAPLRPG